MPLSQPRDPEATRRQLAPWLARRMPQARDLAITSMAPPAAVPRGGVDDGDRAGRARGALVGRARGARPHPPPRLATARLRLPRARYAGPRRPARLLRALPRVGGRGPTPAGHRGGPRLAPAPPPGRRAARPLLGGRAHREHDLRGRALPRRPRLGDGDAGQPRAGPRLVALPRSAPQRGDRDRAPRGPSGAGGDGRALRGAHRPPRPAPRLLRGVRGLPLRRHHVPPLAAARRIRGGAGRRGPAGEQHPGAAARGDARPLTYGSVGPYECSCPSRGAGSRRAYSHRRTPRARARPGTRAPRPAP